MNNEIKFDDKEDNACDAIDAYEALKQYLKGKGIIYEDEGDEDNE